MRITGSKFTVRLSVCALTFAFCAVAAQAQTKPKQK